MKSYLINGYLLYVVIVVARFEGGWRHWFDRGSQFPFIPRGRRYELERAIHTDTQLRTYLQLKDKGLGDSDIYITRQYLILDLDHLCIFPRSQKTLKQEVLCQVTNNLKLYSLLPVHALWLSKQY